MDHYDGKCGCTVFFGKNINLKLLSIHNIIVQCEHFFFKHQNFDAISEIYSEKFLKNFTFFVFVEFQNMSQHKVKRFVAECDLLSFFDHLKNTFNLNKMLHVSIRIMNREEFDDYRYFRLVTKIR